MKITIVTPVFNCEDYISNCIESVISQNYEAIEYIVIDGGSSDKTISIAERYKDYITCFVTEKDKGIYDAINKGLELATGDVVGILNADDCFSSTDVISAIANCFNRMDCDAVYGNLNYVSRKDGHTLKRIWKSAAYTTKATLNGWMPPHPTFYVRCSAYSKFGIYKLTYGSCGDYELMLRFLYVYRIRAFFLNKLLIDMRTGGASGGNTWNRYLSMKNDYQILKDIGVPNPLLTSILKKLRKIKQYI